MTDERAPVLRWVQRDSYYLESDCQRYTVVRALSAKTVTYQAWRRAKPVAELLGTFLHVDDAKACAAAHAAGEP